jgi:hypothetical protein
MTLMAISYDSIEAAVLTLAPFSDLQKRPTGSKDTLLSNYAGHLPLYTIWRYLKRGAYIASIASVAATVGSVLTLIASGLYIVESAHYSQRLLLSVRDKFEAQWRNSSDTSTGSIIMDLLEHENATYPAYTFEELAFPRLSNKSLEVVKTSNSSVIEVDVPARRAALECTLVPRHNISVTFSNESNGQYEMQWTNSYTFSLGVPPSCADYRNLANAASSTVDFQVYYQWDNNTL